MRHLPGCSLWWCLCLCSAVIFSVVILCTVQTLLIIGGSRASIGTWIATGNGTFKEKKHTITNYFINKSLQKIILNFCAKLINVVLNLRALDIILLVFDKLSARATASGCGCGCSCCFCSCCFTRFQLLLLVILLYVTNSQKKLRICEKKKFFLFNSNTSRHT